MSWQRDRLRLEWVRDSVDLGGLEEEEEKEEEMVMTRGRSLQKKSPRQRMQR